VSSANVDLALEPGADADEGDPRADQPAGPTRSTAQPERSSAELG